MKNAQQLIGSGVVLLLLLTCWMGCHKGKGSKTVYEKRQELHEQLTVYFSNYVTGDLGRSRVSLHAAVDALERSDCLEKEVLADYLFLCYVRLVALEARDGKETSAEANLLKARYWRLIGIESSGKSEDEAIRKANQLTVRECMDIADKFDQEAKNELSVAVRKRAGISTNQ